MIDSDKILYLVTDRNMLKGETLEHAVEESILGGVNVVQLREKNMKTDEYIAAAHTLRKITSKYKVPLIINDNIEVAMQSGADGVHLGAGDTDIATARAVLGGSMIIGASARTVEAARAAECSGANYLGVGAVFGTTTKADAMTINTDILREIAAAVTIPVIAIGGVNESNICELKGSGIKGVAVVSAILCRSDKRSAAELLSVKLKQL